MWHDFKHAVILALLALLSGPALVQAKEEPRSVEVFAGAFYIDSDFGDSDLRQDVFGTRLAFGLSDRWSLEGVFSHVDFEGDLTAWFVEGSARYRLNPGARHRFYAFGGPGWLAVSDLDDDYDSSFTLHAGMAVELAITERFYFRPDARVRWIETLPRDDLHTELSVGFGWRF